jgi:small multidrug resistance pump
MKLISYLYLAGGIFCGIVANGYFLKISEGFTKFFPSAVCSILIILAIFFLSRAMNHIPVGFTYATYGGLTITGVTLFGIYKYHQTPNFYGLIGIIFIIVGVFLVNYFGRINS